MFLPFLTENGDYLNIYYWIELLINVLVSFLPAIATALFTAWFLDKAFQKSKHLGDSLVKSGIDNVEYASGKMSKKDRSKFFGLDGKIKPNEICLCFLTGDNFFLDYYNYILDLVDNNTLVKVLIANPFDSDRSKKYLETYPAEFSREESLCKSEDRQKLAEYYFYLNELNAEELSKVAYLERTFLMVSKEILEKIAEEKYGRSYSFLDDFEKLEVWKNRIGKTGDHIMQVMIVTKIVESINKKSQGSKIQLFYYKDEYRIPITLAKYEKNDRIDYLLWTNMNAPVKETTKSVNVFGKSSNDGDATYITDVVNTFDYLFDKYSK